MANIDHLRPCSSCFVVVFIVFGLLILVVTAAAVAMSDQKMKMLLSFEQRH